MPISKKTLTEAKEDAESADGAKDTPEAPKAKGDTKKPQRSKAKLPSDGTLVAKSSFLAAGRHIRTGDLVDAGDPIVSGREHLFTSLAGRIRTR